MIIKLTGKLKNLDGSDYLEKTSKGEEIPVLISHAVANFIANQTKMDDFDTVEAIVFAMELHKEKEIEMSDSKFDSLKRAIRDYDRFPILIKGQLLQALENCKNEKTAKLSGQDSKR